VTARQPLNRSRGLEKNHLSLFGFNCQVVLEPTSHPSGYKSKIEKGSIRLPKKVKIPDGTQVIVRIEPIQKIKKKLRSFL
jgi:Protein of unknown function DUF104